MAAEAGTTGCGPTRRGVLGALLGAGSVLALGAVRGRLGARSPGPVALWAADRAGHRVVGLDGDGLVAVDVPIVAPVAVVPAPSWPAQVLVVSAPAARHGGGRSVVALDGAGRVVHEGAPGPWCHRAELHGDPPGWRVRVRDEVPEGRSRTVVERLARPGRRGFRCGFAFTAGPRCASGGALWLADALGGRIVKLHGSGRVSVDVDLGDAGGADGILAARPVEGGGVWVAAGGALVRLSADGRRMPGQGGFLHLVSLCRGRSPA